MDNPRIKQYLTNYNEITSEDLAFALSGSSSSGQSSKYLALRESIRENGGIFTPIIVNHETSNDEYTVIEGNTRLKFYYEFKEKDLSGKWDEIPCIVYDDMEEDHKHAIRLQAHMVGARDWDAYSKAKYLHYLYYDEKKSMKFLKNFCGGQEGYIRSIMDAYEDMTQYYAPYCEKNEIDINPQDFSYFVELQKNATKEALVSHGYDITDFTKWVIDERVDRAESVRKLSRVLNDENARSKFFTSNLSEAIKKLDLTDTESKKIAKSNLYSLAKELTIKVRNIEAKEVENLNGRPSYEDKRDILLDLIVEMNWLARQLGADND